MVFGLFKKKPDTTKVAIDVASSALQVQLTLGGGNAQQLMLDNFALGYMFGFHDSVFQAMEIDNQVAGFAAMTISYIKLLGDQSTGTQVLRNSLDLQRDQTFMKGMFAGGQEAVEYIRDKKPPMALFFHLLARG